MAVVFKKPSTLTDAPLHYCPGCTHGIIHRLVAEAIEELGIDGKTVGVASVGLLRYVLRLFHLRYGAGAARQSPSGRNGHQARKAGGRCVHLSGATATLRPSVRRRPSTRQRAAKTSPLSL